MSTVTQKGLATFTIRIELEITKEVPLIIQPNVPEKLTAKPTGNVQIMAQDNAPLVWLLDFHRNDEFMELIKQSLHQYLSMMREQDPLSKDPRFRKSGSSITEHKPIELKNLKNPQNP